MFANMQINAVALLVVAFVPARVLSEQIEEYVSDLYSATDHTFVLTLRYTNAVDLEDPDHNVTLLDIEANWQLAIKYPYVVITIHRAEDVSPTCKISGPVLLDEKENLLVIYSAKDSLFNWAYLGRNLETSLLPNVKSTIVNAGVVMYFTNAGDTKPSPIACGKIRPSNTVDDFLEGFTNQITQTKPTYLPSTSNRQISPLLLMQFEAVSDLYSSEDGSLAGSIIYQTFERNSVEVGIVSFSSRWCHTTAVAVVYPSKDVIPGCGTTGPAVSIRDEHNVTRPVTLFKDTIDTLLRPIYGNMVDYASVSPRSDYDITGHVVVVYAFDPSTPIVVEDFLQPTNPHKPIACGAIRSADASEYNFLKWAPAGPKPTLKSETKKRAQILNSLSQRFQRLLMTA